MADNEQRSSAFPDPFDYALGSLKGAQAVTQTKPSMIRDTPPMGVGGSSTFSVQTYRQAGDVLEEEGPSVRRSPARFTVFLEVGQGEKLKRVVIPHDVLTLIIRQRETLTAQAQRRAAKQAAAARKARKA
jgi:hypothetical protein